MRYEPIMTPTRGVVAVLLACCVLLSCASPGGRAGRAAVLGSGTFVAEDGRAVSAVYRDDGTVTLAFPDGSAEVLRLDVSGSGARYTSGLAEWWEHQGTATYSRGGRPTFVGRLPGPDGTRR